MRVIFNTHTPGEMLQNYPPKLLLQGCYATAEFASMDDSAPDDDVLSASPACVRRAKVEAHASGAATVGAELRSELGDLVSVLRGVDVLKSLSDADLHTLCDSLLRCTIPVGELVMRQGAHRRTCRARAGTMHVPCTCLALPCTAVHCQASARRPST